MYSGEKARVRYTDSDRRKRYTNRPGCLFDLAISSESISSKGANFFNLTLDKCFSSDPLLSIVQRRIQQKLFPLSNASGMCTQKLYFHRLEIS